MSTPVSGNIPIPNFNWNSFVEKLNDVAPSAKVQSASFDTSTNNVTLVVGDGSSTKEIVLNIPDLDSPGEIDQAEFSSLLAKLGSGDTLNLTDGQIEELKKVFVQMDSLPKIPERTGNVLFDLYALMAIMLEVAQKQRNAAREIRQTENQAQQTAIQNQADQQRDAALTGLIAGVCASAIQICTTLYSMGKQISASKQQLNILQNSGISAAEANVNTTQTAYNNQNNVLTQMKEVQSLRTNLDSAQAKIDGLQAKQNAIDSTQSSFDAAKAEYNSIADKNSPEASAAKTKMDLAERSLEMAKEQGGQNLTRELNTANTERNLAKAKLEAAEAEYAKFTDAPAEITPETIKTMELHVQDLKSNYEQAQQDLSRIQASINTNVDYKAAANLHDKWQNIGAIFNVVGSLLNNIAQTAAAWQNAEATREGAEQARAQEQLDQIKDLYAQAQEVINKVLSLFNAIIQAENSSMRDAIRA